MFNTSEPQSVFVVPIDLDKMRSVILGNTSEKDISTLITIYESWLEHMYEKTAWGAACSGGIVFMNLNAVSEIVENNIREVKIDMKRQLDGEPLDTECIRFLAAILTVGQCFREFLKNYKDSAIFMIKEESNPKT